MRWTTKRRLCRYAAELLAQEKVVGWLQGRMEFGPRALGSRGILGDARSRQTQKLMNLKVKFRESFRPFAPVVLRDRAAEYFQMRDGEESPYMLLAAPVAEQTRVAHDDAEAAGFDKLRIVRSTLPAITHVDCSARVQTVDRERHGRLFGLLKAFEARTGCPVSIHEFDVRGEPIVCTPANAYRCFMATDIDVLAMEAFVLLKAEQPAASARVARNDYLAQFQLD